MRVFLQSAVTQPSWHSTSKQLAHFMLSACLTTFGPTRYCEQVTNLRECVVQYVETDLQQLQIRQRHDPRQAQEKIEAQVMHSLGHIPHPAPKGAMGW